MIRILLRYNGCHFRLRLVRENSLVTASSRYVGADYSLHDPVNASGKVAEVCTWTAHGGEVFLGADGKSVIFAMNQRTRYREGEAAADWTNMTTVLEPHSGRDLHRARSPLGAIAELPDWMKFLALLYGVAAAEKFLGEVQMSPKGAIR